MLENMTDPSAGPFLSLSAPEIGVLRHHAKFTSVRKESIHLTMPCEFKDLQNIPTLDWKSGSGPDELDRAELEQRIIHGSLMGYWTFKRPGKRADRQIFHSILTHNSLELVVKADFPPTYRLQTGQSTRDYPFRYICFISPQMDDMND